MTDRIDRIDRRQLLNEIATRQAAGHDLAGWLGLMPDPDPVLRKRGDNASVLDELTADDQVAMAIQQRKLGVLEKGGYRMTPGAAQGEEPDAAAVSLRDELWADLERVDLHNLMSELLDAPYHGFTVAEIIWTPDSGRLRVHDIRVRNRHWFGFGGDGDLRFRSASNPAGEPCHPYKFVLARHFPTATNPYGLRLLSRCLWPVAFKRAGIEWWVKFIERFGQPWVVGKSWQGAQKKDREEMLGQLAAMVDSATAVLSAGAEVEIHEAGGNPGDLHREFGRRWDAAISKVLMGQTLTAELSDVGARAASETHYGILEDIRAADMRIVRAFFDDLAWVYAQVNAPGVLSPTWGWDEPEDRSELADQAKRLVEAGVRFRKEYFVRRFDLAEDEFDVDAAPATPPPPESFAAADPAEASARGTQDAIDAMLSGLMPEAEAASAERNRRVAALVAEADSYEEIMAGLPGLLPDVRSDAMTDILHRALLAADLFGRLGVRSEGEESTDV